MTFHLAFEIPKPLTGGLDHESPQLTDEEVWILKRQIRRNAELVERYIYRLDLIVNKERHPQEEVFVYKMRQRLEIAMEENDTYRKVLWKHYQRIDLPRQFPR